MNLFLLQAPNSVLGTKIVLNKQSDLILHGAEIVAPTGIVEADIDGLVSHFTQIEQTISDSGSQLNSGIDNEASIRLEADQSLAADLAAEKGRIDVILDGSTVDLDQFKEVVDFVQSIDLENDESLLNAIVNINQNIDNVIGDFESADSDILDQLSTLTIYTEDQVNIISSGLEQEIIDRADAVQGVQNDLNNYKDYTDTTIINLQNNISMGDESLATSLSSEVSSRISGDESLATLLTNSLDQNYSQLSSDIAAEVSRATTAEESLANTISSDISTEFLRATTAEESLANTIANVISNVDPAALDSLSEIVGAFESADSDLNGAIQALAKDLAEQLKTEAADRVTGDASLESALSTEISDRGVAIDNEASIRLSSDESLASALESALSTEISDRGVAIDNEASIRLSSDESLASALVDEQMSREKGEKDLNVRLESEIKRAEEAEASLEVALSTEVSYLVSNTDLSSIDSFAEVSDSVSVEITRATEVEASITTRVESEYFKKVSINETPNGTVTRFTFTTWSKFDSESIFLNGLLLTAGDDYNLITFDNKVFGITFIDAPFAGDKLKAYGVYASDAKTVADFNADIEYLQMKKADLQMKKAQAQSEGNTSLVMKIDEQLQVIIEKLSDLQSKSQQLSQLLPSKGKK